MSDRYKPLVIFTAVLLLLFSCSAYTAESYYTLRLPPAGAWGVTNHGCKDGASVPAFSTLVKGESRTGILRSKMFEAPPSLSFWSAGHSNQKKNFIRLLDAESGEVLKNQPVPGDDAARKIEWDLNGLAGRKVMLEIQDGDTGTGWAWITLGRLEPEVVAMPREGDGKIPEDWIEVYPEPQQVSVDGIPYVSRGFWSPNKEGETISLDTCGIRSRHLYLLGGLNSEDTSNPGWGTGDSFNGIFAGDQAGKLIIEYKSGVRDEIPFVFGYTIWWRGPYNQSPAPFRTDPEKKAMLDRALCVANGLEGGDKPYYLRILLRDEPVVSLKFEDNPKKTGHPSITGVSFSGLKDEMNPNPADFQMLPGSDIPQDRLKWLEEHTVVSSDPFPETRKKALAELGRFMYTFADDINHKTVAETKPDITPENFVGPRVSFSGPAAAAIMTHVYYENSHEIQTRVDETGMVHESGFQADNYGGFGGWTPGLGAFYDTSYTRLRALTLLADVGFHDRVDKAIAFFDKWLMYFPKAYPEVQLGGKPVPGHAPVIANKPHVYFDELRHVGWPTKYKTRDFGNPENDGHGLLMLTRWRAWVKQGRNPKWVEEHWEALNEAAEYIPWCLDNPELSFSEHGLLYNESEGGMLKASLYCDMPCYLGLLAYAEMAESILKHNKARRWRGQAKRLWDAMARYYPVKIEPWGDVWDPTKNAGWAYCHSTLAPAIIGMDFWGYDALSHLPKEWAERTRRTYRMQLTKNQPPFCAPMGFGYGQGYITQGSLLMDHMEDAGKHVEWMAKLCFAPRLPHPYRAPEGATVAGDGSVWRRWGDLGNLYQMAEAVYTVHLMLGIDDLDAKTLKLMPRVPPNWMGAEVKEWPVRTVSGGKSTEVKISYKFKRRDADRVLDLNVYSDKPLDSCKLRVGPFTAEALDLKVVVNGESAKAKPFLSGDSAWAWIEFGDGKTRSYKISASVISTADNAVSRKRK